MSFNRINFSNNFYEESQNFTIDGSVVFLDASTYIRRDDNGYLVFNDSSTGEILLKDILSPSSISLNLGNIVFVSTNGAEDGVKGNPTRPFDISTAVNVEAVDGDLIYVMGGTYNFAQQLTPRDIDNWVFYFEPNATINFGDASLANTSGLLTNPGSNSYIYGYGNFITQNARLFSTTLKVLEFDNVTCQRHGFGAPLSNGYIKGNNLIMNQSDIGTNELIISGYVDIAYFFINDSGGRIRLEGIGDNIFKFNRIVSDGAGIYFSQNTNSWKIYGQIIDSSNNAIYSNTVAGGANSQINVNLVNVTDGGVGIGNLPGNTSVKVNILTTVNDAINIRTNGENNYYDINNILSTNGYGINNNRANGSSFLMKVGHLETQNQHGIIHQLRNDIPGDIGMIYDIEQITCPSTYRGIYMLTVTSSVPSEEILFKNTHIEAGYPIYLAIGATEVGNIKLLFRNMQLYSNDDQECITATNANTEIKTTKVYANTSPSSNLIPLWDGITVSDRVYPIND